MERDKFKVLSGGADTTEDRSSGEFERWRSLLAEGESTADDPPPRPEEIWDAAAGQASRERTDELLDRSLRDPVDSAAWQMAIHLQEIAAAEDLAEDEELLDLAAGGVGARGASLRRPTVSGAARGLDGSNRPVVWVGAIAAILACAIGLFLLMPEPALDPVAPGTGPDVLRSGQQVTLQPVAAPVMSSDEATLRWSAEETFTSYRVFVTTEDLVPVAAVRDLQKTEWTIPAASIAAFPPGTRLLWRVEGERETGEIVSSEAVAFELASP